MMSSSGLASAVLEAKVEGHLIPPSIASINLAVVAENHRDALQLIAKAIFGDPVLILLLNCHNYYTHFLLLVEIL